MIYDISGRPIPSSLLYARVIESACEARNFPPCVAYAIANRETIRGERNGLWISSTVISSDGGRGLFQLTSSYPSNWEDPLENTLYAIDHFLAPALHFFAGKGLRDTSLIDIVADAFNEGASRAESFRASGVSPDIGTTGGDYGRDVVTCYVSLLEKGVPT